MMMGPHADTRPLTRAYASSFGKLMLKYARDSVNDKRREVKKERERSF